MAVMEWIKRWLQNVKIHMSYIGEGMYGVRNAVRKRRVLCITTSGGAVIVGNDRWTLDADIVVLPKPVLVSAMLNWYFCRQWLFNTCWCVCEQ